VPPRATLQLVVAEGLEPSASGFGHPRSSPVSYATFVELIEFNEMDRVGGFEPPVSCSRAFGLGGYRSAAPKSAIADLGRVRCRFRVNPRSVKRASYKVGARTADKFTQSAYT
jgi:hypothetical protein